MCTYAGRMTTVLDDAVTLEGGLRLALRRVNGTGRPFLLVHGLASNARLWDGVLTALAAHGHEAVAVDLRGHGRSSAPAGGYDTATAAADLAVLVERLRWVGDRAPVVAGQSWGGNVVLTLAAQHGVAAAIALVDGGWIRLADRFPTFDACWAELAPPRLDGVPMAELAARVRTWHPDWPESGRAGTLGNFIADPDGVARVRLTRDRHRSILRSLWEGDPRVLYPRVRVPALLVPALPAGPDDGDTKRHAVDEAARLLPDADLVPYAGADHDLHAQFPARLAGDLERLAARVGGAP